MDINITNYYYKKEHARLINIYNKTKKNRVKKKLIKRLFKLAYQYAWYKGGDLLLTILFSYIAKESINEDNIIPEEQTEEIYKDNNEVKISLFLYDGTYKNKRDRKSVV